MKSKTFTCLIVSLLSLLFFTSFAFATTDMDRVNKDVENAINSEKEMLKNSGNAIKNGAKTIENKTKDGLKDIKNNGKEAMDNMKNETNNLKDDVKDTFDNDTNITRNENYEENKNYDNNRNYENNKNYDNYTVSRTATNTNLNDNMFSSVWTWLIIAVVAIIIIALLMYYSKQANVTTYNVDNDNKDN